MTHPYPFSNSSHLPPPPSPKIYLGIVTGEAVPGSGYDGRRHHGDLALELVLSFPVHALELSQAVHREHQAAKPNILLSVSKVSYYV